LYTEDKNISKKSNNNVNYESLLKYVPFNIRYIIEALEPEILISLEEIRLRAGKPLILITSQNEFFIDSISGKPAETADRAFTVKQDEIMKALELMSRFSLYAYQDEIKNGYITLKGGHRVGITGRVVLENEKITNIKDISGMNLRISREVKGCSNKIIKNVISGNNDIYNTMIVSPPQCGKTTLLRDMARVLSDGINEYDFKGIKTGIVDERSEIAACYRGIPQNDVGIRTDVMDGCPKKIGMEMLLRAMSPKVIITDEIGSYGDTEAIMKVVNAGVKIIASAHGYNISELKSRQEVLKMIQNNVFQKYIVLSKKKGPGTVEEIVDGITVKERIENAV
jgi:stage III sporulation protein AA